MEVKRAGYPAGALAGVDFLEPGALVLVCRFDGLGRVLQAVALALELQKLGMMEETVEGGATGHWDAPQPQTQSDR
jgi:hypothetical protein